jgi:hypothetical protein
MNDEDNLMHGTGTSGPEASPPASLRPPEPPDSLWGIWWVGTNRVESLGQWVERPLPFDHRSLLAFASKEEAEAVVSMTSGPEGQKTRCVPALLGVSPAVVAQRDKLGKVLETALRYIEDSDLYGSEVAYGVARAALAEWRDAQAREGREADVP